MKTLKWAMLACLLAGVLVADAVINSSQPRVTMSLAHWQEVTNALRTTYMALGIPPRSWEWMVQGVEGKAYGSLKFSVDTNKPASLWLANPGSHELEFAFHRGNDGPVLPVLLVLGETVVTNVTGAYWSGSPPNPDGTQNLLAVYHPGSTNVVTNYSVGFRRGTNDVVLW